MGASQALDGLFAVLDGRGRNHLHPAFRAWGALDMFGHAPAITKYTVNRTSGFIRVLAAMPIRGSESGTRYGPDRHCESSLLNRTTLAAML